MHKKYIFIILVIVFSISSIKAQDSLLVGKPYLEDQLYLGFTYNNILNKKAILTQNGLPLGIQTGFIKDIPLNDKQNVGIAVGLGYEYAKFQSNLYINKETFSIIDDFDKNKFETHSIAVPIEFRYRSSRDNRFKFWRVYVGGKVAYTFHSNTVFKNTETSEKTNPVPYLNKWQFGPQISLGYNFFNAYAFWSLTPLFKNAPEIESIKVNDISALKVGLQFYIF